MSLIPENTMERILNGEDVTPSCRAEYFVKQAIDNAGSGGGSITVDEELDADSENPVRNKVITAAIMAASDYIVTFTVSEDGSGNPTVSTTTPIADILAAKNAGKTVKGVADIGMYSQEFPLTAWGDGALGNGMVAFGGVLPNAAEQKTNTFAIEGDVVTQGGVANDRWLLFIG